jgi:6-phosphofructokinase 1
VSGRTRRLAVVTSGGDSPGMNAAIRAVVRRALFAEVEVLGVRRGFAGLVEGDAEPLAAGSVGDIIQRGGTFLRTARLEAWRTDPAVRERAIGHLRRLDVDGLVVIGGDGSMRGAHALSEQGWPTVGVPASIDNDVPGTDRAIGFDSAVNSVVQALDRIRDTASAHDRTFVIEVMGRRCGQIALAAGLAGGAESILVPEQRPDPDDVVERIRRGRARGKRHSLVVLAEGAGRAFDVARMLEERTGLETRVTVLGHVQRGGNPTAADRVLASRLGAAAAARLIEGRAGVMVGTRGDRVVETPLAEVAASPLPGVDPDALALAVILAI